MSFRFEVRVLASGEEESVEKLASAVGLSLSVERERGRSESRLLVAASEGNVVGFVVAWLLPPELEVLDVGVDPDYRRLGVGRALLGELFARAEGEGVESVFREVRASNTAALSLYRSLGFEKFDERKRYYSDGEDAWVLRRTVPFPG